MVKMRPMYFAEILAKNNDGALRFLPTRCVSSERTEAELTASVALKCEADGTILPKLESPANQSNAIAVTDYLLSPLELQRRDFAEGKIDACDAMTKAKFFDLIARSTRFSKTLEFYDKFIGKAQITRNFLQGIERIVSIWTRLHISLNLNCPLQYSPSSIQAGLHENYQIVNRELRQKLADRFGLKGLFASNTTREACAIQGIFVPIHASFNLSVDSISFNETVHLNDPYQSSSECRYAPGRVSTTRAIHPRTK